MINIERGYFNIFQSRLSKHNSHTIERADDDGQVDEKRVAIKNLSMTKLKLKVEILSGRKKQC